MVMRRCAGASVRLVAVLVDLLIMTLFFFPITRLVKGTWLMSAADHRWAAGWFVTDPLCIAFLIVMFVYFVLFEALAGATPGKLVSGVRVIGPDGGRPGLVRSLVRNLLRVVDGLPAFGILAAVLISTSEECARFGDRVAGTRVVRTRPIDAGDAR
ncbi:MAG: hypothetical protein GF405_03195 [Candidatus Eisenbacteria bacterium]|nr:hypothetical protein [Candidatus Eisenbacteria bacterium]